ncbi:11619_t:CDS:2 [Entrophospora sp. SA101]|nr:11619_t:CDS:2 [Entrophospora sp. SA101]
MLFFKTLSDYIRKKSNGKWPTKPPNSFILYRIAYSRELKLNNVKLSIQETSKLVSNSWDNEKKSVKTAYKNLAVEIDKKLLDLRNENSISDQDIYFYNHDHLSIEQLKDYYFSNQQFTSQQVNSSIGNTDNNAHNITNIKAVNNNDDDHRDFMQQQQQQNYDYTSLSTQDSDNIAQIDNVNNIVAVNETNNNVNNINGLNSNYVVDVNNDNVRTIEQNYHQKMTTKVCINLIIVLILD